ncbi:MAG: DUF6323 family protein [Clostridia bacterium]
MDFSITNIINKNMQKQTVDTILSCNEISRKYALTLTKEQAIKLVENKNSSLKSNGRVEFEGDIINKIILGFCNSAYISMYNYEETLNNLVELFFYYKNETNDLMSDDELIEFMSKEFEGKAFGSIDKLRDDCLEKLVQNLKNGKPINDSEEEEVALSEDDYE